MLTICFYIIFKLYLLLYELLNVGMKNVILIFQNLDIGKKKSFL